MTRWRWLLVAVIFALVSQVALYRVGYKQGEGAGIRSQVWAYDRTDSLWVCPVKDPPHWPWHGRLVIASDATPDDHGKPQVWERHVQIPVTAPQDSGLAERDYGIVTDAHGDSIGTIR